MAFPSTYTVIPESCHAMSAVQADDDHSLPLLDPSSNPSRGPGEPSSGVGRRPSRMACSTSATWQKTYWSGIWILNARCERTRRTVASTLTRPVSARRRVLISIVMNVPATYYHQHVFAENRIYIIIVVIKWICDITDQFVNGFTSHKMNTSVNYVILYKFCCLVSCLKNTILTVSVPPAVYALRVRELKMHLWLPLVTDNISLLTLQSYLENVNLKALELTIVKSSQKFNTYGLTPEEQTPQALHLWTAPFVLS